MEKGSPDRHKENRLQLEGAWKKKPGEKTLEDCYQQRIIPGGTMGERRDDIYFLVILIIWKYVHNQSTVHVSDNVDLN